MDIQAPPLKIRGLTKKYGSFTGANDINLELTRGEVFGFLGPNGAGKSTTIRTILNFLHPTSGSASVFGLDSVRDSIEIKRHIGYLAGDIALYDTMTGKQLLAYLSSLRHNTDWEYVATLTKRLDAQLDKPIHTLSKGNKQKIGLIQAFMHKPELIILDEPASGLDPLMKQVFYDMVYEASATGSTVFVSSHDLTEVQKICQRAAFIRDGNIVAIETIGQHDTLQLRDYIVTFGALPSVQELSRLPGVSGIKTSDNQARLSVTGEVGAFIAALGQYSVIDLETEAMTLEDIFMHYYSREETDNE